MEPTAPPLAIAALAHELSGRPVVVKALKARDGLGLQKAARPEGALKGAFSVALALHASEVEREQRAVAEAAAKLARQREEGEAAIAAEALMTPRSRDKALKARLSAMRSAGNPQAKAIRALQQQRRLARQEKRKIRAEEAARAGRARDRVEPLTTKALVAMCAERDVDAQACFDREELIEGIVDSYVQSRELPPTPPAALCVD